MKTHFALRFRGWCTLLGVAATAQFAPVRAAAPVSSGLWYGEPARTWHEALPVGNGRIGALVHGGTDSELTTSTMMRLTWSSGVFSPA